MKIFRRGQCRSHRVTFDSALRMRYPAARARSWTCAQPFPSDARLCITSDIYAHLSEK
jgi:hypothetical protein